MKLKNKTVLITGGSTGIGKATAEAFIEKEAKIIIFGLYKPDYSCEFHKVDVSKEEEIKSALSKIKSIDILINNAGIAIEKPFEETTADILNKTIDVNLKGVFWVCRYSLPKLREGSCIININSIAGIRGFPGISIYNATKAGVIILTETLANELGKNKIRVNCIAPGTIETEIWEKMYGKNSRQILEELKESKLLKRNGRPEEIAHAAIFLSENEFVNGETIVIDGGETKKE